MSAQYWPGRDYPDREVWLKRRATNLRGRINRVIHDGKKPFVLGLNKLKRQLDAAGRATGVTRPRQTLIQQRHAYYRRDDAQATPDAATAGDSASAS